MTSFISWLSSLNWYEVIPAIIALGALWFTARQARFAKMQADIASKQADIASKEGEAARMALAQTRLLSLYSSFDAANQATLQHPELLYDAHGLDREVPIGEARSIAYLSVLLDGYQKYWSDLFGGDCSAALEKLKGESTFLNRLLAVPANQHRWELIKRIYYGDFDRDFVGVIEGLIAHEHSSVERPKSAGASKDGPSHQATTDLSHNPTLNRTDTALSRGTVG